MSSSLFGKTFSLQQMRNNTTLLRLQKCIHTDGSVKVSHIRKIKKNQLWNYLQFIFTINKKNAILQRRYIFGDNDMINISFLKHIYDTEHLQTKQKTIKFINSLIKTNNLEVYDSVDEYDNLRKIHEVELQECRKLQHMVKNMKIEIKPKIEVIN